MEHLESTDEWRDRLERQAAERRAKERRTARQASWVALGGLVLAVYTAWRSSLAWFAGAAGLDGVGDGLLGLLVGLWTLLGCFWLLASVGGDATSRLGLALAGLIWITAGLILVLVPTL